MKAFLDVKKDNNALTPTLSASIHILNYFAGTDFSCWQAFNINSQKYHQEIVRATEKVCLAEVLKTLKYGESTEFLNHFEGFNRHTLERFIAYCEEALENDDEHQTLIEKQEKNEYLGVGPPVIIKPQKLDQIKKQ